MDAADFPFPIPFSEDFFALRYSPILEGDGRSDKESLSLSAIVKSLSADCDFD